MPGTISSLETSILGPTQSTLKRGALKTTRDLENTQMALGTGRKHQSYGALGAQSAEFSVSEFAHSVAEAGGFNIRFVSPILGGAQSLSTTLSRLANEGYSIATQVKNGGLDNFDVKGQAVVMLNQAMDMMNTRLGGLSISSGSASDRTAWDKTGLQDPATYNLDATDDVALPQGYQGDSNRMRLTLGEQTHDITFAGSELGPQRLVRALHILSTADKAVDGDALYAQKIDEVVRVLGQAKTDMRNIEAQLSLASSHIENAKVTAKEKEFAEKDYMQEINGTNNLETIPLMMALSTMLSSIQSVMAKDSELTNELRSILDRI